ncbi:MAG: hypothetical protein KBA66_21480 [Leptospiraceae bacterium]|nr:hypothetical protein [Leptospiraceae bacterium]
MKNIAQRILHLLLNNYFLLFLYILLVSYVTIHHEVWRDEADSWLVARDISYSGLFQFTRNSGHPSFWYWILIPFAKFDFPYYTLSIIHLSLAIAVVYLILFHSTLNKYLVILLIFGYYFFFEYAVVARNYALSNFLLFLIAAIYKKRFEKPILFGMLLFLLANANMYATIIASGIGLLYLIEIIEEKKYTSNIMLGFSLIVLGGIACLAQVYPSNDRQVSPTDSGLFFVINYNAIFLATAHAFAPGVMSLLALFSLVLFPVSLVFFYRTKKVFIFFIWVICILFFFFTFIYMGGYRHAGFLLMTLIFSLWIKPYYEIEKESEVIYDSLFSYVISKLFYILFIISLLFSLRFSYKESKKEILYSYSNAKEMSEYILANGYDSDDYIIVAHNLDRGKTILYYLKNKKTFYYPALDSFGSYMLWDKKMSNAVKLKVQDMLPKTREKFAGKENILFLSDTELKENKEEYDLLYKTQRRNEFVRDEEFFLYKLKLTTK